MEQLFITILNMSITGSVIILAMLIARLCLKRAPRIFSYVLWAVVLFRLLCPVSFFTDISFLGILEESSSTKGRMEYIPADIGYQMEPQVSLPVPGISDAVNSSLPAGNPAASVNPMQIWLFLGSRIWLLGIGAMLAYSAVSLLRLKKKLKTASHERENIYRMPGYGTPFVYGIIWPRIYLSQALGAEEERYILLHEQIHIRRKDPFFRALAYLALCLHWFNPLVWLAFSLSGQDMEMSCDEAVIRRLGSKVKKEYSASLLALASGHRMVKGLPLAFGEGDTKSRIENVLHYQKPGRILAVCAAIVCVVLAVQFVTNPRDGGEDGSPEQVFYGIVTYADAEGDPLPVVVRIPRFGDVDIPEADSVEPYIEIDFDGLEIGDLIRITFPKGEEISVMETYPARFSQKAEKIEVMSRGLFALQPAKGNRYRFTVPLGMAPEAQAGDLLNIYRQEEVKDGQLREVEFLHAVEILEVVPENSQIWVNMSPEEVAVFLSEFGFGLRCELIRQSTGQEDSQNSAETSQDNLLSDRGIPYLSPENLETLVAREDLNGIFRLNIQSIARSARGIDRYVIDRMDPEDSGEELPFLAFSEACVFQVNREMDSVRYEEVDFEEFVKLAEDGFSWINPLCTLYFEDNLITNAALESAWYGAGIAYEPFARDTWYEDIQAFPEMEGIDPLKTYYTQVYNAKDDFGESPGMETAEVYTGNIGDGDSGIVLFKNEAGELLYSEGAHTARAGWNNIYLGEQDGTPFLMRVHIEDRDTYGGYDYQVFRLGEKGEILQIAGSSFSYGDDWIPYDEEIADAWMAQMNAYLDHSQLLLSTQDGEVRTE
jgi:beta-lactamase regulating signal transducer with metallopeptidase domain